MAEASKTTEQKMPPKIRTAAGWQRSMAELAAQYLNVDECRRCGGAYASGDICLRCGTDNSTGERR